MDIIPEEVVVDVVNITEAEIKNGDNVVIVIIVANMDIKLINVH